MVNHPTFQNLPGGATASQLALKPNTTLVLFSDFLDICEVLLVYICNSKILEMDLLVMLILIILATWIRRNLSQILFFMADGCDVS